MWAELDNDIGYTPFTPAIVKDSSLAWNRHEQLKELKLVLALCDGNAFRSRIAKRTLNLLGLPSVSAAVGDITKQKNNVLPPASVLSFMTRKGTTGDLPFFRAEPMRIVSDLMVASAAYILAFCEAEHLKHVINLSDRRLHLVYAKDPESPGDYYATYKQVVRGTVEFFHEHYRDRSIAMTAPPHTSAKISERIAKQMSQLDFSIVPRCWGDPLISYDSCGNEIF